MEEADPDSNWRPNSYTSSFWGTDIGITFPIVKLLDFSDRLDALEHSDNPFARFVVAHLKTLEKQGDYETRLQWKLRIIQGLYDMGVPEAEIGQLYHDFDWLLALSEPLAARFHTTMTAFEETKSMPHLSTAERIGRKIGRDEGRKELLIELMTAKFGPLPEAVIVNVNALSPTRLKRVSRAILTAETIEELRLNVG